MNPDTSATVYTIQCFEPASDAVYSMETTARIGNVSRRMLVLLHKHGLLTPVVDPELGGYYYNDEAIRQLHQIEYLRSIRGVNLRGIKMILELMDEMNDLKAQVNSLRNEVESLSKFE